MDTGLSEGFSNISIKKERVISENSSTPLEEETEFQSESTNIKPPLDWNTSVKMEDHQSITPAMQSSPSENPAHLSSPQSNQVLEETFEVSEISQPPLQDQPQQLQSLTNQGQPEEAPDLRLDFSSPPPQALHPPSTTLQPFNTSQAQHSQSLTNQPPSHQPFPQPSSSSSTLPQSSLQQPPPLKDPSTLNLSPSLSISHYALLNGEIFKGTLFNNNPFGYGKKVYASGASYEGNWMMGLKHGHGVKLYSNGDRYEGNWYFGFPHGYGLKLFADGEFYLGDWVNGVRQGFGKHKYKNCSVFIGNWEGDLKHGKGHVFLKKKKYRVVYVKDSLKEMTDETTKTGN